MKLLFLAVGLIMGGVFLGPQAAFSADRADKENQQVSVTEGYALTSLLMGDPECFALWFRSQQTPLIPLRLEPQHAEYGTCSAFRQ